MNDAIAEVREAVDFCRYYALRARADFDKIFHLRVALPGARPQARQTPSGWAGRGLFACISPVEFPVGHLYGTGHVAALAAGNSGGRQAGRADTRSIGRLWLLHLLHRGR